MQPLLAPQAATMPLLPCSPSAPGTAGQVTVVSTFVSLQPLGSWEFRKLVNRNVSPELSARCSGTTFRLGSGTPGLSALIAGSSQLVIFPVYMPTSTAASSLSGTF